MAISLSDKPPKNKVGNWCCKTCRTTDESLRYKSGMMEHCYTCQGFINACKNAEQKKRKLAGKGHKVRFTFEEFHAWAKNNPRRCRYCGINDAQYRALQYVSANGKFLEALGLDRLVDGDYDLGNITWCCYICNRTKNSHMSPERMDMVGELFRKFWIEDLQNDNSATLFDEHAPRKQPRVISDMPGEIPPALKLVRSKRKASAKRRKKTRMRMRSKRK